jgi:hypothetical protein
MRVRILPAGATKQRVLEISQAELLRFEPWMLAGEDERRHETALGERGGDGLQFDGFGPGPDDQPNVSKIQPSP